MNRSGLLEEWYIAKVNLTFIFFKDIMQKNNLRGRKMKKMLLSTFLRGRKMKKMLLSTLSIMLIFFASLPAQNSANDAYIKAMNSTDVNQRAKLLKDWVSKYEGQGSQYENFACASLCNDQYKGKTPADIIKYGEPGPSQCFDNIFTSGQKPLKSS